MEIGMTTYLCKVLSGLPSKLSEIIEKMDFYLKWRSQLLTIKVFNVFVLREKSSGPT
jgi:hypothetical protein